MNVNRVNFVPNAFTPKLCFSYHLQFVCYRILLNRAFNPASQLSKLLLHSTPLLSLISSGKAPTFEANYRRTSQQCFGYYHTKCFYRAGMNEIIGLLKMFGNQFFRDISGEICFNSFFNTISFRSFSLSSTNHSEHNTFIRFFEMPTTLR